MCGSIGINVLYQKWYTQSRMEIMGTQSRVWLVCSFVVFYGGMEERRASFAGDSPYLPHPAGSSRPSPTKIVDASACKIGTGGMGSL